MSNGTRKSNFSALTTIPAGATFDFVINGMNYKIPVEDMIAAFGTTGTLSPLGEVTGTALLTVIGDVNYIRNAVDGPGITTAVTAEGGVQISHNLQQGGTGVPVLSSPSTSPVINSIEAGAGINVSLSDGTIQVATSAVPVSTKTVIVNEIADFPAASGGVITLADDTEYRLTNSLSTVNSFILGDNCVVSGSDDVITSLTYTGTGTMFTSSESTNKIKELACVCTSGTFLAWAATASAAKNFQILSSSITCGTIGSASGFRLLSAFRVRWEATVGGLSLSGSNAFLDMSSQVVIMTNGTFLDLDAATFSGVSFQSAYAIMSAGTYILDGLADSGNINALGTGAVFNVRLLGDGTFLNNISQTDPLWEFELNDGVPDSISSVLSHNDALTVTIASVNTPAILGATWDSSHISRFVATAGGRFTYTGKGAHLNLAATITADIVTGTKISCTFYFFKNGVAIPDSAVQRDFTAGNSGNFGMLWAEDLETDDYIEVFAENNDSTANITIINVIFSVS